MKRLRGVTWDHPRGYRGLEQATASFRTREPEVEITWERHSLHHFEAHPIAELAATYDLIVLDHPFMGDAARQQCLVGLETYAEQLDLAALAADTVGPSFASYRYGGDLWSLPIDAACQVAAFRPDLLATIGAPAPGTLEDVHALAQEGWLALALGGVHAFMIFLTLCANHGAPMQAPPDPLLGDRNIGISALETLRTLAGHCPPEALTWNSIAALDALARRDDLLYSPYIFGFSSYSAPSAPNRLVFTSIPAAANGSIAGSVIGGTGIAISRTCADQPLALAFARYVTSSTVQLAMGLHDGQPARRGVWRDAGLNEQYAGFFANTLPVIEVSWMRPRYAGYVPFQSAAGEIVTAFLREGHAPRATLDQLQAIHRRSVVA